MCFGTPKDEPVADYQPTPMMPMIRLLHMCDNQSRSGYLLARMINHNFTNVADGQYNVLTMPAETTEKWSAGIAISNSDSVDGMVSMPRSLDHAFRFLWSTGEGADNRPFWIRSPCIYHDDAFEAAYYEGTYLSSIYEHATKIYIWSGGFSSDIAVAVDWIQAAVKEISQWQLSRSEADRVAEPWPSKISFSIALGERQDSALVKLLSRPAFLDQEMWILSSGARAKDVPVQFLSERASVYARDLETIVVYFSHVKPDGMSTALSAAMEKIRNLIETSAPLARKMFRTIPSEVITRRSVARSQYHRIESLNPHDPAGREIEVFELTILQPGHGRKLPERQRCSRVKMIDDSDSEAEAAGMTLRSEHSGTHRKPLTRQQVGESSMTIERGMYTTSIQNSVALKNRQPFVTYT